MATEHGSDPDSSLHQDQCWLLLRSSDTGRLGVVVDGEPDIFPVTFVVDHATIVFRTAPGTKLTAALVSPAVAFEVDGVDPHSGEAWSVVVKGHAEEIKQLYDLLDTTVLPLFPWHRGSKHRFVRIVAEDVTGRRFQVADRVSWYAPFIDARRCAPD